MKKNAHVSAPVLVMIIMALSLGLGYIDTSILGEGETMFMSVAVLQLLVLFVPTLIYCRVRGVSIKEMRLRAPSARSIPFLLSSVFVVILGGMLISFAMSFFGVPIGESSSYSDYVPSGFASRAIFIAVAFAVVPALTEELLCRSVLIREYENIGVFSSIFLSAVLFSMLHFNAASFPIYFFSGLVLGFVSFVTRSVLAAMAVHLFNNLYILFFQEYAAAVIKVPQNLVFAVFFAVAFFLLALFFMLMQAESIVYRNGALDLDSDAAFARKEKEIGILDALLSPTFLLCVAAWAVLIFVTT